jgi:hypothetical protein
MSFPPLSRRTLLRSGTTAGCLAFTGAKLADASPGTAPLPLTGPLAGWLVVTSEGGGQLTLFEIGAQSRPVRQVGVEIIPPLISVAAMARQASAAAVKVVAASWRVPAADCNCRWGRIEHRQSGRSIPFTTWTDFT